MLNTDQGELRLYRGVYNPVDNYGRLVRGRIVLRPTIEPRLGYNSTCIDLQPTESVLRLAVQQ